MPCNGLTEIKLALPSDLAGSITSGEIIDLLLDKAFCKAEYYRSRCSEFTCKYRLSFTEFKQRLETSDKEIYSEWDDLLLWEGYELARMEWQKKYEELRVCMA